MHMSTLSKHESDYRQTKRVNEQRMIVPGATRGFDGETTGESAGILFLSRKVPLTPR